MFMELNAGLKIVRMVPTKIPGDLGYEAELQRDARKMQGHFDEWWLCAKELIGASVNPTSPDNTLAAIFGLLVWADTSSSDSSHQKCEGGLLS